MDAIAPLYADLHIFFEKTSCQITAKFENIVTNDNKPFVKCLTFASVSQMDSDERHRFLSVKIMEFETPLVWSKIYSYSCLPVILSNQSSDIQSNNCHLFFKSSSHTLPILESSIIPLRLLTHVKIIQCRYYFFHFLCFHIQIAIKC